MSRIPRTTRPTTLIDLPIELLDTIALYVACPTLLGPPQSLVPLLQTCQFIHNTLDNSTALYSRIFRWKFSWSAFVRRELKELTTGPGEEGYKFQLALYTKVLKRILKWNDDCTRNGFTISTATVEEDPDPEQLSIEEMMWVLFIMCLEDDGCNRVQLDAVGAYSWVETFARRTLHDTSGNWPEENSTISCALHVLWYLTTKERLLREPTSARDEMSRLLLPFVTLPFRYTSSFAPPNHFQLPLPFSSSETEDRRPSTYVSSIPTPHGSYPIYISSQHRTWHHLFYSHYRIPLTTPLVTQAAKLLYSARRELFRVPPLAHLSANRREHQERHGERDIGPTAEDWEEMNDIFLGGEAEISPLLPKKKRGGGTMLSIPPTYLPGGGIDESMCSSRIFDNDWWKLRRCLSCFDEEEFEGMDDDENAAGSVFTPGEFTGLWVGRMYVPSQTTLTTIQRHTLAELPGNLRPPEFSEISLWLYASSPVFMRLKEWVLADSHRHAVPAGSMNNAWFPHGTEIYEEPDGSAVIVQVPSVTRPGKDTYVYRALTPGDSEKNRNGIGTDIIVTGSTDPHHAQAWYPYRYYGRIRQWDGCLGVLRVPVIPNAHNSAGQGRFLFYGSLVGGNRNLVGNWRVADQDEERPGYEGAFNFGSREDE